MIFIYQYNALVTNVVDGDTFDVDCDMGFHIHNHIRVRLLGINTPEKFGEERPHGEQCKRIATNMFLNQNVVIQTQKTDSFGRWLCYLHDSNGNNVIVTYNNLGINKLNAETYKWKETK